jgi:hypothetical protein
MAKNQSCLERCPAQELAGTEMVLTGDEYALLQRLRDFSFVNGGIPANELFIKNLAKTFHVSAYKFKRIWPVLENFFEKTSEGIFVYPEDEAKRVQRLVLIAKRKIAGHKGAETRWGKTLDPTPSNDDLSIAKAIFSNGKSMATTMVPDVLLVVGGGGTTTSEPSVEPPPPPTPSSEPTSLTQNLPEPAYQAICQKTIDLGMAIPSRKLAQKIWEKFPGRPIDAVVQSLVRWEGQLHAGLWGEKTLQDFELECFRQANGGRKPSASDQRARHVYEVGMEALARKRAQNA